MVYTEPSYGWPHVKLDRKGRAETYPETPPGFPVETHQKLATGPRNTQIRLKTRLGRGTCKTQEEPTQWFPSQTQKHLFSLRHWLFPTRWEPTQKTSPQFPNRNHSSALRACSQTGLPPVGTSNSLWGEAGSVSRRSLETESINKNERKNKANNCTLKVVTVYLCIQKKSIL